MLDVEYVGPFLRLFIMCSCLVGCGNSIHVLHACDVLMWNSSLFHVWEFIFVCLVLMLDSE